MKIQKSFYIRDDVVLIAKELLGKYLYSFIDGKLTGGVITETEAYVGITDRASHSYGNKRTKRTKVMYQEGGTAYIYLCYGMYSLFNVVTNKQDIPDAILIRGLYPTDGINTMFLRTNNKNNIKELTNGPGKLSRALGLHFKLSGSDLTGNKIWLEDRGIKISKNEIITSKRIGIDYAGEDAKLPYRFNINLGKK